MANKNLIPTPVNSEQADAFGFPDQRHEVGGDVIKTNPNPITSQDPFRIETAPVTSDAEKTYVAASVDYRWYTGGVALPQTIDEAEEEFGYGVYPKMFAQEATLQGAVNYLRIKVLRNGLTFLPAYPQMGKNATREQIRLYDSSAPVRDYIQAVFEILAERDRDPMFMLGNAFDCTYMGHKLIEQTAEIITSNPYRGKTGLAELTSKPRANYNLVNKTTNNRLDAVIGVVPGGSIALRTGIVANPSQIPNAISAYKFLNFTVEDRDGDPRGVSWFRAAYDPFYRKQLAKIKHMTALDTHTRGIVVNEAPQGAETMVSLPNPFRNGKIDTLLNILADAASVAAVNGSMSVLFGTKTTITFPHNDPAFFDSTFRTLDNEMTSAYLTNARATMEAEHGSKNDTDNADDAVDDLACYIQNRFCIILKRLVRWLVNQSYGQDVARQFCPVPSMARTDAPDFSTMLTALGQFAASSPALAPNQWDWLLTDRMDFPAPIGEPITLQIMVNVLNDASAKPATAPVPPK